MTDKFVIKIIAILVLIILFVTSFGVIALVQANARLDAIEIVARHHAQEDADWWQIVDLAGGGE